MISEWFLNITIKRCKDFYILFVNFQSGNNSLEKNLSVLTNLGQISQIIDISNEVVFDQFVAMFHLKGAIFTILGTFNYKIDKKKHLFYYPESEFQIMWNQFSDCFLLMQLRWTCFGKYFLRSLSDQPITASDYYLLIRMKVKNQTLRIAFASSG